MTFASACQLLISFPSRSQSKNAKSVNQSKEGEGENSGEQSNVEDELAENARAQTEASSEESREGNVDGRANSRDTANGEGEEARNDCQDDVHEDEDDSENISKTEWDVQRNSCNEGNGGIKRDNNLATGPRGGTSPDDCQELDFEISANVNEILGTIAGIIGVAARHEVITMFLTNGEAVLDGLSMSEQAESDKEKEEGICAGEVHVVDVERVARSGSD